MIEKLTALGEWRGTAAELAELLGCASKTARRWIKRAEEVGAIEIVSRGDDGFHFRPNKFSVSSVQCSAAEKLNTEHLKLNTSSRTRGRPRGSKTVERPAVTVEVSRCPRPRCGSTKRTKYVLLRERELVGVLRNGMPYTHVVWRHTQCADCGQHRTDIAHENRPEKSGDGKAKAKASRKATRRA